MRLRARALLLWPLACGLAACRVLLGIDDVLPLDDAGVDGARAVVEDAAADGSTPADASVDTAADAGLEADVDVLDSGLDGSV